LPLTRDILPTTGNVRSPVASKARGILDHLEWAGYRILGAHHDRGVKPSNFGGETPIARRVASGPLDGGSFEPGLTTPKQIGGPVTGWAFNPIRIAI